MTKNVQYLSLLCTPQHMIQLWFNSFMPWAITLGICRVPKLRTLGLSFGDPVNTQLFANFEVLYLQMGIIYLFQKSFAPSKNIKGMYFSQIDTRLHSTETDQAQFLMF